MNAPVARPRSRPQTTREGVLSFIEDGQPLPPFPFLVGRRGFYADSLSKGVNGIGVYDDALFLVEADRVTAWNANCDPSRLAPEMATLVEGRWRYRPGTHNISKDPATHPHYRALVQASWVTVYREGTEAVAKGTHSALGECLGGGFWRGYFGVNIHRGGETTTSSAGCQTIVPEQWPEVMPAVDRALARGTKDDLFYILTTRFPARYALARVA